MKRRTVYQTVFYKRIPVVNIQTIIAIINFICICTGINDVAWCIKINMSLTGECSDKASQDIYFYGFTEGTYANNPDISLFNLVEKAALNRYA